MPPGQTKPRKEAWEVPSCNLANSFSEMVSDLLLVSRHPLVGLPFSAIVGVGQVILLELLRAREAEQGLHEKGNDMRGGYHERSNYQAIYSFPRSAAA